jgi:hypothetical protein
VKPVILLAGYYPCVDATTALQAVRRQLSLSQTHVAHKGIAGSG